MKLSCLCATHNRPEFMPWLAWVYKQIDWDGPRELVLVDSTPGLGRVHPVSGLVPEEELVFIPSDAKDITTKYNQALESASGDLVYWLDDDDYHCPNAVQRCLPALERGAAVYPWVNLFWLRMPDLAVRHLDCFWWSAGLYRREALLSCPRFEGRSMCTEIRWIKRVMRSIPVATPGIGTMGFCLAHGRNISNRPDRQRIARKWRQEPAEAPARAAPARVGRQTKDRAALGGWLTRLNLTPEHGQELLFQLERLKERLR